MGVEEIAERERGHVLVRKRSVLKMVDRDQEAAFILLYYKENRGWTDNMCQRM